MRLRESEKETVPILPTKAPTWGRIPGVKSQLLAWKMQGLKPKHIAELLKEKYNQEVPPKYISHKLFLMKKEGLFSKPKTNSPCITYQSVSSLHGAIVSLKAASRSIEEVAKYLESNQEKLQSLGQSFQQAKDQLASLSQALQ